MAADWTSGKSASHAAAGVDHERDIDWDLVACKEGQRLLDAVLEYREVGAGQAGDVSAGRVGHGHGQWHHRDAALERWALRVDGRRAVNGERTAGDECREKSDGAR